MNIIAVAALATLLAVSAAIALPLADAAASAGAPTASRNSSSHFTANWMGTMMPLIADYTLLDLSLPGTHDTMTYDLSTTVADHSNDIPDYIAWFLHEIGPLIDKLKIGDWIRRQAKSQGLTITEQLNSGIRFVDFRVDYTAPAGQPSTNTSSYDWYTMHFVEGRKRAIVYLAEIRAWLRAHPTEIVVIWVSHHGSNCHTDYEVPPSVMRSLWKQIRQLFGGVMYDTSVFPLLNQTTVGDLIRNNMRAVFYTAQHRNFTGNSTFAMSDCLIDNDGPSDGSPLRAVTQGVSFMRAVPQRIRADKLANTFFLASMSGPTIKKTLMLSAELEFLAPLHLVNATKVLAECSALFQTPGVTAWCPRQLQAKGQWINYYYQIVFDFVSDTMRRDYAAKRALGFRLPNAIYIDAVDHDGTIRTGEQVFWPPGHHGGTASDTTGTAAAAAPASTSHGDARYSYLGTLLLSSTRWICSGQQPSRSGRKPDPVTCANITAMLEAHRAKYRTQRWHDPGHGRLANYPPLPKQ